MYFYRARETILNYIMYEKKFTHNTALIACEGHKVISVTLKSIIESLNQAGVFFEPHRSYIINIDYVDRIHNYGNYSEIYFKETLKKALMSSARKKLIYNLNALECL